MEAVSHGRLVKFLAENQCATEFGIYQLPDGSSPGACGIEYPVQQSQRLFSGRNRIGPGQ